MIQILTHAPPEARSSMEVEKLAISPIGGNGIGVLAIAVAAVWFLAETYTHLPFAGESHA
jgi:hypothetical protein